MSDVKDTDLGYRRIMKLLQEDGYNIYVGVRGPEALEKPVGKDGKKSDATVVEYATYNEFGTDRVPERSFLRSTVDENREKYFEYLTESVRKAIEGQRSLLGRIPELIGERAVRDVQKKIRDIKDPPNAPSTIKKKNKSSNPLIDTGTMRNAISYIIKKGDS